MQTYILILLVLLILLLVFIIYYGQKHISTINLNLAQLNNDVCALQSEMDSLNTLSGLNPKINPHSIAQMSGTTQPVNDEDRKRLEDYLQNEISSSDESDYENEDQLNNINMVITTPFNSSNQSYQQNNVIEDVEDNNDEMIEDNIEDNIENKDDVEDDNDNEDDVKDDVEDEEDNNVENVNENSSEDSDNNLLVDSKEILEQEYDDDDDDDEENEISIQDNIELDENKNKKQKNTPNEKAKDYETGHILISENDGNQYIVTESKNGSKRWKKV